MFYDALCLFQRRCWKIKINPFHSSFYERFIIFMAFKVAHTEAQLLYCALNRFMFFDENNESSAVTTAQKNYANDTLLSRKFRKHVDTT